LIRTPCVWMGTLFTVPKSEIGLKKMVLRLEIA
jgi:hypothetical protein